MRKKWLIALIVVVVILGFYQLTKMNLIPGWNLTGATSLATTPDQTTRCPAGIRLGDVNGDGKIDAVDTALISRFAADRTFILNYPCADANGNGVFDAVALQTLNNCILSTSCGPVPPFIAIDSGVTLCPSSSNPGVSYGNKGTLTDTITTTHPHIISLLPKGQPVPAGAVATAPSVQVNTPRISPNKIATFWSASRQRMFVQYCGSDVPEVSVSLGWAKKPASTPTVVSYRLSPNSPIERTVVSSANTLTPDVTLGIYDLQVASRPSTINSLVFKIKNNPASNFALNNLRLSDGSNVYGAASFAGDGSATFSNLNIKLTSPGTWKSLTLKADFGATTTTYITSATLVTSSVVGVDDGFNLLSSQNAPDVVANSVRFSLSNLVVKSASANSTPIVPNGQIVGYNLNYTFTLENNSNQDVFISKNPSIALATSTAGSSDLTPVNLTTYSGLQVVSANIPTAAGDTMSAYVIPAGAARSFTYVGAVSANGSNHGSRVFSVKGIYYGTSASRISTDVVNSGLGALSQTVSF